MSSSSNPSNTTTNPPSSSSTTNPTQADYNPKLDPSSPEFDLDAVPPPPPGGLPIDKLVVEPAMFTGGFPGITSETKKKEEAGEKKKKEGEGNK